MAVQLANEVRAVGMPIYCSACFNQNPGKQHVDLDAACDRGYGDSPDGLRINMDDLILCEDCIKAAARLVGWGDLAEVQAELATEHRLRRQEMERADRLENYLNSMEAAFSTRPEPIIQPRRRGRPPREE